TPESARMEGAVVIAEGVAEPANHSPQPPEKMLLLQDKNPWKPWPRARSRVTGCLRWAQAVLGVPKLLDWYCLCALGVITALISFFMDSTVLKLIDAHRWLFRAVGSSAVLQYLCWTLYPIALTTFSTSFTQSLCPQSAGSGAPEVKTILSGVMLEGYLTLTHLAAKVVGMTCTLAAGSTIFLGKVGPFVHVSCMVGSFLDRVRSSIRGTSEKDLHSDMLVAGAAVAMASCFGCPISGVLFSVEVMSSHYSVRNYCRAFFAAVSGAVMFRLLAVFSSEQVTIMAMFKTRYQVEFPFDLPEMFFFAILGLLCGAICCAYLFLHRWLVTFTRTSAITSRILATDKALYSGLVALLLASMTFPHGIGQFMGSRMNMRELLNSLFDGRRLGALCSNSSVPRPEEVDPEYLWLEWCHPRVPVYGTLGIFLVMKFWMLLLATTMPMPAGYFMPVVIYGAAIGRFVGEVVAYLFPEGMQSEGILSPINPGGYSLAGAAAFSGAVTHTLSPALLVFEMTGQIAHVLPVVLATLISNALCRRYQPSFYDGIIILRKLPYLPQVLKSHPELRAVRVEQAMRLEPKALARSGRLAEVRSALASCQDPEFPVVDTHETLVLLGSVCRSELVRFLHLHAEEPGLDRELWEVCSIQPITFQLSNKTTIQQAHTAFLLLGLNLLYVTEGGRLTGLMSRAEMKKAIEDMATGKISAQP
uniref:Chloride channel K n=1 Tax=Lepisosteus oculatus TaxID=7918 RepID=W5MMQ1_LEPOC